MAKSMKILLLHYPMIQFLINEIIHMSGFMKTVIKTESSVFFNCLFPSFIYLFFAFAMTEAYPNPPPLTPPFPFQFV